MAIAFYYKRGSKQFGPCLASELKSLADSGQLTPHDMVRTDGMTEWKTAGGISGLFPLAEIAPPEANKRPTPPQLPNTGATAKSPFQSEFTTPFMSIDTPAAKRSDFPQMDAGWVIEVLRKLGSIDVEPSITAIARLIAAIGKWICVGIGLIFIIGALNAEMAPAQAAAAGVACFFGICARICQAEQYMNDFSCSIIGNIASAFGFAKPNSIAVNKAPEPTEEKGASNGN